ncbi:MAG: DNA mismatch repair protein MutS [Candidatus Izemoplasmatales bacterium]|jgi:DNA mismatch repair protein MutS
MLDQFSYTPMMQQYLEIKKDYTDFIVFFRLGDFYEMFFTDAVLASKELEIVLTGRDAGVSERVPMCGVPYHAADLYIERLISKGFKVAIVEQVEDPSLAKGLVRREVVRLITPGTIIDEGSLDAKTNNFIGALTLGKNRYILAYCDLSTGVNAIVTTPKDLEIIKSEVMNLEIRELVIASDVNFRQLRSSLEDRTITLSLCDQTDLPAIYRSLIQEVYDKELISAFARLVNYLIKTQKRELMHMQKVEVFESVKYLNLDNNSIKNLELIETYRESTKKGSLFWLLDRCETAMGSRMLKQSILRPLVDKTKILDRLAFVEALNDNFIVREEIRESLKQVYDLERIIGRISFGNANAKDLQNLKRSLRAVPLIKSRLETIKNELATVLVADIGDYSEMCDLIDRAIVDNPPLSIKEGGIIKKGFNEELDNIRDHALSGKDWIQKFESAERERTGIKKLRIGYNRVFGYYIEISKGQLELVKSEFGYERKQTLVNSERFVTDDLKRMESLILGSEEQSVGLEYSLFTNIRDRVFEQIDSIQKLARSLSLIDMLIAFSIVSMDNRYVKPTITDERTIEIISGRHPVVETLLEQGAFVENDVRMGENTDILLITGPNMSGKSTYMRQLALSVIMMQIGCFIPAAKASLPLFDRIFTRIGASDDLSTGKSTFMVEMLEVNFALQNATKNSLILFDEIGRGTATYDGMALAQAIIEYCHHKIDCKILFSTHYHELTYLEDELKTLHNVHVLAREEKGNIVFLHKVTDGPTDKSYGIHVAKLAKLPAVLLKRASLILEELEKNHGYNVIKPQTIDLFNFEEALTAEEETKEHYQSLIDQLRSIDVDELTPLKALNILAEVIEEAKKKHSQ